MTFVRPLLATKPSIFGAPVSPSSCSYQACHQQRRIKPRTSRTTAVVASLSNADSRGPLSSGEACRSRRDALLHAGVLGSFLGFSGAKANAASPQELKQRSEARKAELAAKMAAMRAEQQAEQAKAAAAAEQAAKAAKAAESPPPPPQE
eukprot:CAMPEP_0182609308 /NCGR_PEP_ID=MMETSP1330-20130603/3440_1 /TAXON_ID=464278 /ORGANISM="Picochlorum sp., Strain RCC944" /LENGTH=148 /DNA_ID=CAMNT_0024828153 /DNA_START=72 /DNA_END=518 /DNA_ORIENTATION=+